MYQSNSQQQQEVNLEDLDFANFVLSELKRSAREYTTAALEAANPGIRQTFEKLLQSTLDDQALVFQEIQKLGGYEIQPATQQLIQQELQKQSQTSVQVQSIVQQHAGRASAMSYTQQDQDTTQMQQSQSHVQSQPHQTQTQSYQTQPQHQMQSYTQQESQQQNQIAAPHQTLTPSFQPVNYANQYPNAAYNNASNRNNQQSQGYMPNHSQAQAQPQQQSSYTQTQGRSYQQDHSYGQSNSSYGREVQSYAASANQAAEHSGSINRPAQARMVSRNQPGTNASTSGGNSNMNRSQEGNKYNF